MRTTDIAIVGGGLAGSMTAAMLGRAGIDAVLIDPHRVYPDDFRCEKLGGPQIPLLQKTGLADAVFRKSTHDREVWIAQYGHLIDRRPSDQRGILYQDLVGAIRDEIPAAVPFIEGKAASIATDDDRQIVTLSDGGTLSTRLVVLANGLNLGLLKSLGIRRRVVSPCHSITIGFDLAPVGRPAFAFPALTYYPERATERMAYLTLFPVGATMRANLMVYRPIDDPWLREMREAPEAALHRLMPRLHRLTGNCRSRSPPSTASRPCRIARDLRRASRCAVRGARDQGHAAAGAEGINGTVAGGDAAIDDLMEPALQRLAPCSAAGSTIWS
jgi:2-polyprenyl-6-methoxyphenol hydroxylase-like FAD-dependent oxidoreductase